jgi:plastocyanin
MRLSTLLPVTLSLATASLSQSVVTVNVLPSSAPTGAAAAAATSVAGVAASSPSLQPTFQNGTSSGTTAAQGNNATALVPSGGSEKVWIVKVGAANGTFVFAPNALSADPGDWVQFQFEPRVSTNTKILGVKADVGRIIQLSRPRSTPLVCRM